MIRSLMTTRRLRLAVALYWLAFFGIMHTPRSNLPSHRIPHWDKVIHCGGYAILALLCAATALRNSPRLHGRWFATWLGIFAAYAAFDELTQELVGRSADIADWVADMVGVVVALIVVAMLQRRSVDGGSRDSVADGVAGS